MPHKYDDQVQHVLRDAAHMPVGEDRARSRELRGTSYEEGLAALSPIQRKADGAAEREPAAAARAGARDRLPGATQRHFEGAFGADFSGVRVQEGSAASALGATAYAQGDELQFAPGAYDPASAGGMALIGHELTHVLQQRAGRAGGAQGKDGINGDPSLEHEADDLGTKAAKGERVRVPGAPSGAARASADDSAIQCYSNVAPASYGTHKFPAQSNQHNNGSFMKNQNEQRNRYKGTVPLRVSESNKLAIEDTDLTGRQPKAFYCSDQGLIADCNKRLLRAGSPFRLVMNAGKTIQLNGLTFTEMIPHNNTNNTEGYRGGNRMKMKQWCDEVVTDTMGGAVVPVREGQDVNDPETRGNPEINAAKRVGRQNPLDINYRDGSARGTIGTVAKEYGKGMKEIDDARANHQPLNPQQAAMDQRVEDMGLNQYAQPEVGEAYVTYGVDPLKDGGVKDYYNQRTVPQANTATTLWQQHWGGVVAKDGGDRITMENYARGTEDNLGDRGADPRYYFQMYGTAAGQSWHEQWKELHAGSRGFANPLTMVAKQAESPNTWNQIAERLHPNVATIKNDHGEIARATNADDLGIALYKALVYAKSHTDANESASRARLASWKQAVANAPNFPEMRTLQQHVAGMLDNVKKGRIGG